jgi:MtaA/CmuA family methyltransferase
MIEEQALLADKTSLAGLKIPDPLGTKRMFNGLQAVARLKERIGREKIVEGWIEGPCAEAADLRGINTLMLDFYDDPAFVRDLFEWVVQMELRFAREQIRAGADLVGVGDAAASLVGPEIYQEFVWPFEKKLIDGIHALGGRVRLHICGNTRFALEGMGKLGAEVIDLDFLVPLDEARSKIGPGQVVLGNLNPLAAIRNSSPERIHEDLARCHAQAGPRFIVGAGCEIPRDTPHENVRALFEFARHTRP